MRLKLHSIAIQDFKGVSGRFNVDLDGQTIFLSGPNGYGKTTIYDAIELCITGTILRIDEGKGGEYAGKRHGRSVLHNDPEKDIRLELNISRGNERRLIRVVCPRVVAKQPFIDWGSFTRTLHELDGEEVGAGESVTEWLGVSSENYKLFTYLQQSDSTFFLRLAQKERHEILTPLIDAGGYEEERVSIENAKKKLGQYKAYVSRKLSSLESAVLERFDESKYERMLPQEVTEDFEAENLFQNLNSDQARVKKADIIRRLNEIENFLDKFSPSDYVKSEQRKFLVRFKNDNDFLNFLVLSEVLNKDDVLRTQRDRVKVRNYTKDVSMLRKYILRSELSVDRFEAIKRNAEKFINQRRVLYVSVDTLRPIQDILTLILEAPSLFSETEKKDADSYIAQYKPLAEAVGMYGKLLGELQQTRDDLTIIAKRLHDHGHDFLENSCPYCGTAWKNHDELINSITEQTQKMEKSKSATAKKLSELEVRIKKEFLTVLVQNLDQYTQDYLMYEQLKVTGALGRSDHERCQSIESVLPGIKELDLSIKDWSDNLQIAEAVRTLQSYIEQKIPQDEVRVMAILDELSARNYDSEKTILARLKVEVSTGYVCNTFPTTEEITDKREGLSDMLGEMVQRIEYNPGSVLEEHVDMYKRLFLRSEGAFKAAKSKIKSKRAYVEQEYRKIFIENRKTLENKLTDLSLLYEQVSSLHETYNKALKDYQKKITKDLQLPFYLYTSKILQNTPQSRGIFMHSQKDSKTVVFTTARNETLDAAHQLSSGQLVVVSMAFYLAMNTVYPHKGTGIMLIDDPIQDLDVLNIHSLTELIRRRFARKYQLIMSTHNELDINYMRYKLGTVLPQEKIKNINVQELFFNIDSNLIV